MKHFLSTRSLTRDQIIGLIIEALRMVPYYWTRHSPDLTESMKEKGGKKSPRPKLVTLFDENSTRTKYSFEEAAKLVGFRIGSGITPNDSSMAKGESPSLTLRMLIQQGADVVVLRSKIEGLGLHLAQILAKGSSDDSWVRKNVSIIVGGAGMRDHPSQVILDMVTIVLIKLGVRKPSQLGKLERLLRQKNADQALGRRIAEILDNLKIAFVGDLFHSRVTHDWLHMGRLFSIVFNLISPSEFRVEDYCKKGINSRDSESLDTAHGYDVLYAIRTQMERLEKTMSRLDAEKKVRACHITRDFLDSYDGILMDAQPVDSNAPTMDPDLYEHPKNAMLMESAMGIPTRMALLRLCESGRHLEETPILEEPRVRPVVLQEGDLVAQKKKLDERYAGRKDLRGKYVSNGTVIDRLPPGTGLLVRQLCGKVGLLRDHDRRVIIENGETHLPLPHGLKDIIQLYNRWPSYQCAAIIGLIAPTVRFSFMKEGDEREYRRLEFPLPKAVAGIFTCLNPNCITDNDPEAETFFWVEGEKGNCGLQCAYCEHNFDIASIVAKL